MSVSGRRAWAMILEINVSNYVAICIIDRVLHCLSVGPDVRVSRVWGSASRPRLIRTAEVRCTVWGMAFATKSILLAIQHELFHFVAKLFVGTLFKRRNSSLAIVVVVKASECDAEIQ